MNRLRAKSPISRLVIAMLPIIVVAAVVWLVADDMRDKGNRPQSPPLEGSLLDVVTPRGLDEQIIDYEGMRVSFNKSTHNPNWVAWELTRDETGGSEPRGDNFARDYDIEGCSDPADYRRSGYDRGHMAPAADMKWSPTAMSQSFLMTNICPQAKRLNTGSWRKLEEKCRGWAIADSAIIIICGPVPEANPTRRIGDTGVVVPSRFFKVILSPYASPARGIGFIMDNGEVKGGMQAAAMSIDEVERVTGYDFFAALPDDIEAAAESQSDFNFWSTLGR